jgi:ubiquinone/menaquinone biosynthesis C-methylase UbiE
MTTTESQRPFLPGMGLDWLLPLYDPFTRLLGLDGARRELLRQADLRPGQRVLDIGCGTGGLIVLAKRLSPEVEAIGLDPDPKALARAERKAQRAGVHVTFERGFSDALDFGEASFDRVFSSFMFHHLERHEKARTLLAVRRVLKPDGSLHLLDFDGPDTAGHRTHRRGVHSHHRLAVNNERTILSLFSESGLTNATRTEQRAVVGLVRIAYYRAGRSFA